ncbi:MAG TPA: hypothetical protein VFS43_20915 [Polyangiaceae bacterium]|nr:hypothetical protein [Polyangiaceae bacterium]
MAIAALRRKSLNVVGVLERFEDRAQHLAELAGAGGDELAEGVRHRAQLPDLLLDVLHLGGRELADVALLDALERAQPQELFDLVEGEAEVLRPLDEPDDAHRLGRVDAVARACALRRPENTPLLVVAERLHVDPGPGGHVADEQAFDCHAFTCPGV